MKIFLTPMLNDSKSPTRNPYIDDLIKSLEENGHIIINKNKFSKIGLFDILFYLNKADAIYFNWIEDLIDTRFGFLQTLYVYFSVFLFKILNKKVIWTLHNKISHSKDLLFFKIINTYFLLNYADLVLTHATNGIEFSNAFLKDNARDVQFIHHPIYNNLANLDDKDKKDKKEYDILIWGAISPYKGIDKFLDYLSKKDLLSAYKICIVGKIKDKNLEDKILKYMSSNIQIINQFVEDEVLKDFIIKSKIVLFTYTPANTFASGALMYSLSFGSSIIGPNVGSFKDLSELKLISTYHEYEDLIQIINTNLLNTSYNKERLSKFISENEWFNFGSFISKQLRKNNETSIN